MNIEAIRTDIFREGDDLADFVLRNITTLSNASLIVIASKVVSLAEGHSATVSESSDLADLIRSESDISLRSEKFFLTLKDGMLVPNAGIDESNGDGRVVLHPENSYESAKRLRDQLINHYGVQQLGIIVADSHIIPLRAGTTGIALGYAGFRGIRDYRGKDDLYGRPLEYSRTNIADSLATTATLMMGEGAESTPLAIITRAPVEFVDSISKDEIRMDPEEDLYALILNDLI